MAMILAESLEGEIAAMTTDEKRELARVLMRMVAEELAGTRGTATSGGLVRRAPS